MVFDVITYGAGVIGGLALIAGPFTGSGRVAPRWTRIALPISGVAGLVWGFLGYALLFGFGDTQNLLRHFKTLSSGVAIGILVLLFSSGEFGKSYKRYTHRP